MLSVLCPQCKSAYKVDEARIPPQGGVITCKQCQMRISVRLPAVPAPAPAPVEEIEELSDADEVPDDATLLAPPVPDEPEALLVETTWQSAIPPELDVPPAPPKAAPKPVPAAAEPPPPDDEPLPEQKPEPKPAPKPAPPAAPRLPEPVPSLDISLPTLGQAAARAAAAASAPKPAHEIAPGSSLYECPHCHKPFYLSEAKSLPGEARPAAATRGFAPVKATLADGRKTVLVVDDQEFFRSFARDLLGRRYRVLEARTVSEAVDQLHECQLIVLDLTLENEDGRQVLKHKPAGVKCLIFSGQEDNMIDPAIFRELQELGADDMLFKSIAAGDALKEKVGRMLGEIVDEKPSLD